jgi:hypothetical protein
VLSGAPGEGGATGTTELLLAGRLGPAELDATTVQVSWCPWSPLAIVYWPAVAPATFVPSRCHEYAKLEGLLSHEPGEQVSVASGAAVPEISGGAVFDGTGVAGGAITATAALTAGRLLPVELDATTVQVRAWFTSPEAIV